MGLYSITLHAPSGETLADLSNLCTKRSYSLIRNREGSIDLTLNFYEAQDLANELGYRNQFYGLFAAGMNEIRITRGNRPVIGGEIIDTIPNLGATGGNFQI